MADTTFTVRPKVVLRHTRSGVTVRLVLARVLVWAIERLLRFEVEIDLA